MKPVRTACCIAALIWLCAGALSGCTGSNPRSTSTSSPPSPTLLADESVQGRVVTVNVPLRYVVMDFPLRSLPVLNQRLGIYREGQKIGEVRVTGPIMDTAAAGDILTGHAAVGDEVREE
jgi:hypothetical protein